ncbi:hypothetical protein [Larkinella soli]|uniref:hypothetical protein n=1 Tax=Larkinella soli TaxID=1770527 RepID=UPI000FFC9157|nr:hypothetical protein [Larkinella soli]
MIPPLTRPSVNWIDGMKLNRTHLQQQDNAFRDGVRDAIALGLAPFAYGLLPQMPTVPRSLELDVQVGPNGNVKIRVPLCRAVTPGGGRIEINDQSQVSLQISFEELREEYGLVVGKENDFDIILTVGLFDRIPFGDPLPDEIPPRHPYTLPKYTLSVVPTAFLSRAHPTTHFLTIGKLIYDQQQFLPAEDYIPPCLSISSHLALVQWHQRFGDLLAELEQNGLRVLQKIYARNQASTLTDSTQRLVTHLLMVMADGLGRFRWLLLHEPPVYLIEWLVRLVQSLRMSLALLPGPAREEVLEYWAEWADIPAGQLDQRIMTLAHADYVHVDIAPLLGQLDDFFGTLTLLMQKLSQLEFVGKRKGEKVVISANPVAERESRERSRWSPL